MYASWYTRLSNISDLLWFGSSGEKGVGQHIVSGSLIVQCIF
jgi:hypothetical protein